MKPSEMKRVLEVLGFRVKYCFMVGAWRIDSWILGSSPSMTAIGVVQEITKSKIGRFRD